MKRAFRRDEGFALALVMGAIVVITIIAVGAFELSQQTLQGSTVNSAMNKAYQAASTGLEQEVSLFSPSKYDSNYYPRSANLDGGDGYKVYVDSLGNSRYMMRSVGHSGDMTETVLTTFQYLNLWDMNISGGTGGVGSKNGFNGNSTIFGALYVAGPVDWGANGRLYDGPIMLSDATWNPSGNGQVGTALNPVDLYGVMPVSANYHVVQKSTNAPGLQIPTISEEMMQKFQQEAVNTSNETSPTGVPNASAEATAYCVWTGDAVIGNQDFGNPGDAVWFRVSDGILHIRDEAVIYCSGTITFTSAVNGYMGRGTIVAHGTPGSEGVTVQGASLKPATGRTSLLDSNGEMTDQGPMMTSDALLGIVTMANIGAHSRDWLCAFMFTNGNIVMNSSDHGNVRGSIICSNIDLGTTNVTIATQPGASGLLPQAMPKLSNVVARGDWVRR